MEGRLKANYTRGSKLVVGLVSVHPAKQSLVRKVGESGSLGNPSLMEERQLNSPAQRTATIVVTGPLNSKNIERWKKQHVVFIEGH